MPRTARFIHSCLNAWHTHFILSIFGTQVSEHFSVMKCRRSGNKKNLQDYSYVYRYCDVLACGFVQLCIEFLQKRRNISTNIRCHDVTKPCDLYIDQSQPHISPIMTLTRRVCDSN
jgi:hypothetical protein